MSLSNTFQYMSVFFNVNRHQRLSTAYADAAITIADAHGALTPLVAEAGELLAHSGRFGDPAAQALSELDALVGELFAERTDLATRLVMVTSADARTAYLLSTLAGRPIDSTIAATALGSGWTYDEAVLRRELAALLSGPRPFTAEESKRIATLEHALDTLAAPFTIGGIGGDLDSDFFDPRVGVPLHIAPGSPLQRGRDLIVRALNDTANPDQILRDEFEVFFHDNGNLTLVLPGVIDLTNPRPGADPETNSLRDLDQQAIGSAFSTGVYPDEHGPGNGYAQRIVDWAEEMVATGVIAAGTQTTIIGHSFGGDTAFDLASDSHFNGELLDVTHAFSAGYNSFPQLEHLPAHTRALTATNIYDLVQLTERLSRNGARPADRIVSETAERAINTTTQHLNRFRINKIPEIELDDEDVIEMSPNGVVADFEGGFTLSGAGHHQDEYVEFIERVDDPLIEQFLTELDTEGFTADAVAVSVDISDPTYEPS